jgi:hypothetical protein
MLSKGRFAGIDEGQAVIQFAKEQEFFAKNLDRNGKKDLLRDTLGRILGRPIGIKIDITAEAITPSITPTPPPTPTPNAPSPTHPTAATTTQGDPTSLPLTPDLLASIQSDPLIKSLLDNFGGTIIKVIEQ